MFAKIYSACLLYNCTKAESPLIIIAYGKKSNKMSKKQESLSKKCENDVFCYFFYTIRKSSKA